MLKPTLADVRIVLVEPAGPLNVGAIARVMKNMGLQQLVLVNPQCDPLGAEARQMAVHAGDRLKAAKIVPTLEAALVGCQRVIATTARDRTLKLDAESPEVALPWLLEAPSALVFGPEDRGLSNIELNFAQRFVRIPSSPEYPALNLAQAVTVCCYELFQRFELEQAELVGEEDSDVQMVPFEGLEAFYQHLEAVLLKIGYLYPHTTPSRMAKFRRLFNRSQLSASEVAMLRGILSQVEWAIHSDSAMK